MKNQKGFAPIIILLIVAVLGGIGYFTYTKGYASFNLSKLSPTFNQEQTPTLSPVTSWGNYSDSARSFTFKYPPELEVKTYIDAPFVSFRDNDGKTVIQAQELYSDLDLKNFNEMYIAQNDSEWSNIEEGTIKIESRTQGRLSLVFYAIPSLDTKSKQTSGVLIKGSETQLARLEVYGEDPNTLRPFLDQILSTFKFTQ